MNKYKVGLTLDEVASADSFHIFSEGTFICRKVDIYKKVRDYLFDKGYTYLFFNNLYINYYNDTCYLYFGKINDNDKRSKNIENINEPLIEVEIELPFGWTIAGVRNNLHWEDYDISIYDSTIEEFKVELILDEVCRMESDYE